VPEQTQPSPISPPDPQGGLRRRSTVSSFAALVAASCLGGGAALGAAWAVGAFDDSSTTTVVQAAPIESPAARSTSALSVGEIYRRAGRGVVQITTTSSSGGGLGSGFVIDHEGHIVTNYHVIEGADSIKVNFAAGQSVDATLVGSDPSSDIALLKVDTDASSLFPLSLADSAKVQVGDPVVAIGNPFGLERTVTAGIVSALQRAVRAPNGFAIDQVIQTDAPINQGNSGGPLIDAHGQVIGVNSQIETGGEATGNVGIGFAVPSDTVKTIVAKLLADGKVEHAYVGVTLQELDPALAKALSLSTDAGLLLQQVHPDSPASKAGLRGGSQETVVVDGVGIAKGGDILVAIDGHKLGSIDDLRANLEKHAPGDTVSFEVVRGGKTQSVKVVLGQQPATAS
jgi:S1-C subfamily serine protease